jgi:Holliday junction resolvase RusA-like endonuclease
MSATLCVEIPGKPEPQGSARAFVVGGRARVTSANPKLKSWRAVAVHEIRAAMAEQGWAEGTREACSADVRFVFPRPKSHLNSRGELKKSAPAFHTAKPDLDKCLRAALDALTLAGAWCDDSQCAFAICGKDCALPGESPRTVINIHLMAALL